MLDDNSPRLHEILRDDDVNLIDNELQDIFMKLDIYRMVYCCVILMSKT